MPSRALGKKDATLLCDAILHGCPDWEQHEKTLLQQAQADFRQQLLTKLEFCKFGALGIKLKESVDLLKKLLNNGIGEFVLPEK